MQAGSAADGEGESRLMSNVPTSVKIRLPAESNRIMSRLTPTSSVASQWHAVDPGKCGLLVCRPRNRLRRRLFSNRRTLCFTPARPLAPEYYFSLPCYLDGVGDLYDGYP